MSYQVNGNWLNVKKLLIVWNHFEIGINILNINIYNNKI